MRYVVPTSPSPAAFTVLIAMLCSMHAMAASSQNSTVVYLDDSFEQREETARFWNYASCALNRPHGIQSDKTNGALAYPELGQASRKGYCAFISDPTAAQGQQYLRFTTMPFDRRDADPHKDNLATSVDWRKGGSEMRSRPSSSYDEKSSRQGWDLTGNSYHGSENVVRYEWQFRLTDVSMISPNSKRIRLASSAVIGQFHSQNIPQCNRTARYDAAFSPAPGLNVSVVKLGGIDALQFSLDTKLTNAQARHSGLETCSEDPAAICNVPLWTKKFALTDVAKLTIRDTHAVPWIKVSYSMQSSRKDGMFRFRFGVNPENHPELAKKVPDLAYQEREFANGLKILHIPTTQNDCPNVPYLGAYVLGYSTRYYGSAREASVAGGEAATSLSRLRKPNPSAWVHPAFAREYGKFMDGTQDADESPPQFVIDYDAFRVVQERSLRRRSASE